MSVSSPREAMLATIRNALGKDVKNEPTAASSPMDGPARLEEKGTPEGVDVLTRFESELTKIGGRFHRAPDGKAAAAYIAQVAAERDAKTIITWDKPLPDAIDLKESLAPLGIELITQSSDGAVTRNAESADIGVTGVDYALAETGSLVLLARCGQARSISLLPPVHIALIKPAQVISGFDDLFALLRRDSNFNDGDIGSAVTFITGPSRTADIELTLVVGVHGPQELHAILLED